MKKKVFILLSKASIQKIWILIKKNVSVLLMLRKKRLYTANQELFQHYQIKTTNFEDDVIYGDSYWYNAHCTYNVFNNGNIDKLLFEYGIYGSIKTYLCVSDPEKMLELFTEVFEKLAKTGHGFNAKVSACKRKDTICLWVIPEVLQVVKDFAKEHEKDLCKPLPFVPFNGYVGISKEFSVSFNQAITVIVSSYFLTISAPSEITAEGLIKNYLHEVFTPLKNKKEFPDRKSLLAHDFHKQIRNLHVREHFIILDSFNAILCEHSVDELVKLHETQLEDGKILDNIKYFPDYMDRLGFVIDYKYKND